jgi:hypothetical protein
MMIFIRFPIKFLLCFSLYASPSNAQVEGSISGKAAIEEDSSNGPTAAAAAGKVRRMAKRKKNKAADPLTCPPQTKYLRTADEICGKTLDATGTKYVVSAPGNVVDCMANGPTVTGNAILDCSQATIQGLGKNPAVYNYGITVGGSAVLQNCVVSNFMGNGVVLDTTPGDKTVINTRANYNAYNGFLIEREANNNTNKLVNIKSNNNGYDGVYIKGNGDNTLVFPKVQGNGYYGVEIGGSGANKLVNVESIKNGYDGVRVGYSGNGDNTIVSPKIEGNGYHGVDIAGLGTNKLTDVDIKDNAYGGINSYRGITEVHGGVIKNNGGSGVRIVLSTSTTIKEVVIKKNEGYGVYLAGVGQTSIIEGSLISKNIQGGVKNKGAAILKISCSSIQSNGEFGFGVQMGNNTDTTIMDTDVSNNSVNIQKDGGNATLVRIRACDGFTDDVIGFNGMELTTTTCDSTDCGLTFCTECQHVVETWCTSRLLI